MRTFSNRSDAGGCQSKPATVTAWKVVNADMSSIWAGSPTVDGKGTRTRYPLGKTVRPPESAPAVAFVELADASKYCVRSAGQLIIKARVEVAHPADPPFEPNGSGEKVWCSAITPLCIVNENGTETFPTMEADWHMGDDGAHRVVVGGPDPAVRAIRRDGEVIGHVVGVRAGGPPSGTYKLYGPEPEPERVVPIVVKRYDHTAYECPSCMHRFCVQTGAHLPMICPNSECGVRFKEASDA